MTIGDIRPKEVQDIEVEAAHVAADLQPAAEIRAAVLLTQAVVPGSSSAAPMQTAAANISPIHGQSLQPIFE